MCVNFKIRKCKNIKVALANNETETGTKDTFIYLIHTNSSVINAMDRYTNIDDYAMRLWVNAHGLGYLMS